MNLLKNQSEKNDLLIWLSESKDFNPSFKYSPSHGAPSTVA